MHSNKTHSEHEVKDPLVPLAGESQRVISEYLPCLQVYEVFHSLTEGFPPSSLSICDHYMDARSVSHRQRQGYQLILRVEKAQKALASRITCLFSLALLPSHLFALWPSAAACLW